jgi:tripartite-type tricarboxylate transporter receptor subunit TctC
MRELGALLRGKNLQYNYGSTGPGSVMHVIGETFKRDAKVDMAHIAYKGAAPLKLELLSGRIQVGGDQLSTSLAEIRAGQLKALATSGSKRIAILPDVPTVREQGFAALEFEGWNGLLAPAKTPRAVIEKLQRETAAAVRHPDVQKRFSDLGAEPVGSSPEDQKAIYVRQMKQFTPVIREMKLD